MPQTKLQIELSNGFSFAVEHEVKTLADFRKLLKKADTKIAAASKAVPEMNDEKVAKARIAVEGPKTAAAAGS